jgi:hypothetical protein
MHVEVGLLQQDGDTKGRSHATKQQKDNVP